LWCAAGSELSESKSGLVAGSDGIAATKYRLISACRGPNDRWQVAVVCSIETALARPPLADILRTRRSNDGTDPVHGTVPAEKHPIGGQFEYAQRSDKVTAGFTQTPGPTIQQDSSVSGIVPDRVGMCR